MERGYARAASIVLCGAALIAPARAVPPTVTPSPGYDARSAGAARGIDGASSRQCARRLGGIAAGEPAHDMHRSKAR